MIKDTEIKILVLGPSRGGTTLISAALGAHPSIAMLDEDISLAINKITGGKIAANKLCIPNQIELNRRWKLIYSLGRINGFFRKSLLMNKVPLSQMSIRDYDGFGKIQHVCILRHPHGVISSIEKRENKSRKVAVYRWRRSLEIFKELDCEASYSPVFISFEALLKNPDRVLKKLCDELKIPYVSEMLDAPFKNTRYGGNKFDESKGKYDENAEKIWNLIPCEYRALYEDICLKCL